MQFQDRVETAERSSGALAGRVEELQKRVAEAKAMKSELESTKRLLRSEQQTTSVRAGVVVVSYTRLSRRVSEYRVMCAARGVCRACARTWSLPSRLRRLRRAWRHGCRRRPRTRYAGSCRTHLSPSCSHRHSVSLPQAKEGEYWMKLVESNKAEVRPGASTGCGNAR